ncbi:MAG: tRNA-dihydrouridine synthase [Candidatus Hydrogenedentes bacterium]|nr:tRNA-dihydrouridine synthase [Candidatus Hydrogenedentota bacterium]
MLFGNIDIKDPLCLAPMEDVTDLPFRKLCKSYGADVLYTEFVNCEAVIRNVPSELNKFKLNEDEHPIGIQLYGSNPDSLERAAAQAQTLGNPDFIDMNCGCWVRKIAGRGDGAGLLRDLDRLSAAVAAVQRGSSVPVTVKTRLGWDENSLVILEVAPMLAQMGIQSLTIHCRTRVQGYSGTADWSWIPKIKEAAPHLPLIANGDICTPQDVETCFNLGADGVMIGRAAMQKPWVFRTMRHYLDHGILLPEPSLDERKEMCISHLKTHVEFRGARRGIYSFRRYYGGYFKGTAYIGKLRRELMTLMMLDEIIEKIQGFSEE